MKTLIVYTTSHGCTEKCAFKIKGKLSGEVEIIDLKKSKIINLSQYETVIIGGSIHAGRIQGRVQKFAKQNLAALLQKKLGLFLCCMEENENARQQFDNAFLPELREHASAHGLLGGEFNFDKMNFFERAIIRKISKINENVSKISEAAIDKFVNDLTKA
ncbi:flavodoxin domain-containing protein [candidate division KSB1 bacterium]|nr:flavodoxin domain-containing protein [candidate division KSB1 bacterium]